MARRRKVSPESVELQIAYYGEEYRPELPCWSWKIADVTDNRALRESDEAFKTMREALTAGGDAFEKFLAS